MKKLLFVLAVIASLFAAGCKKSYHLESYENEWFLINIEQNGVNVSPYLMGVEATLTGEKVSSDVIHNGLKAIRSEKRNLNIH